MTALKRVYMKDAANIYGEEPISGYAYIPPGTKPNPVLQENWHIEQADHPDGKYHLIVERDSWLSNDLRSLENRLRDFIEGEGYAFPLPLHGFPMPRDDLQARYNAWLKAQGVEPACALELLHGGNLTRDQREWLSDFSDDWEAMESYEQWGGQ